MDAITLWNKILDQLELRISTQVFNGIKNNTEPITLRETELILLTENTFIKEIIEKSQMNTINDVIKSILNRSLDLTVIESLEEMAQRESKSESQGALKSNLNPRYTFESFVIGNSNRFAHAACVAVAESPAKAYNPLFLYGGVGLGKTHLMHAIGHQISKNIANAKIIYLSSETFMNEMINSIKDDTNEAFRNKYRNVDVLLIDDIQFIQDKESTQEEFFHTFNALHNANKQIIISSDRPPKDIPTLEDRLRSRFEMGLITDIQPPDYETRIAILRKKSQEDNKNVPDEVIEYVAKNINSNIRELEGAITRISAYADLNRRPITLAVAEDALHTLLSGKEKKNITVDDVKNKVAQYYSISVEDFSLKKRTNEIAYPRQVAMYICRVLIPDIPLSTVGKHFGGRDHTTVMHAEKKIASEIKQKREIKERIEHIISDLKNN